MAPLLESLHYFRLSKSPPSQAQVSKNVQFKTESLTNYNMPLRGIIPNPNRTANNREGLGGGGSPHEKPLRGTISNHNRGCGGSESPCATNVLVKEDTDCGMNQAVLPTLNSKTEPLPTCGPAILQHHVNALSPLPTTLEGWRDAQNDAQAEDEDFLDEYDPDTVAVRNGLHLYIENTFPTLILVPPSLQEPLVRQKHADVHHVGHEKVLPVLAKRYFWPTMKTECRKWLQNCATCENSKAARNEAHGMFSARPLACWTPCTLLHGRSGSRQSHQWRMRSTRDH